MVNYLYRSGFFSLGALIYLPIDLGMEIMKQLEKHSHGRALRLITRSYFRSSLLHRRFPFVWFRVWISESSIVACVLKMSVTKCRGILYQTRNKPGALSWWSSNTQPEPKGISHIALMKKEANKTRGGDTRGRH